MQCTMRASRTRAGGKENQDLSQDQAILGRRDLTESVLTISDGPGEDGSTVRKVNFRLSGHFSSCAATFSLFRREAVRYKGFQAGRTESL